MAGGLQAAELLVLVLVIAVLMRAAEPIRRRLESWIARRLGRRRGRGRPRVIPLTRRGDGRFEKEDPHES